MKTIQISVERNFHILNDDRFIMEKISMTAEVEEGDLTHEVINAARDMIVDNFKFAYPKVEYRMNFDEVIQTNKNYTDMHEVLPLTAKCMDEKFQEIMLSEKINKGTIEEHNYHSPDIEAIKKEIQSYKYGVKALKSIYGEMAKDSPELKKVFDEKVEELEHQKSNSINQ